jgi:hypothetical protein
MTLRQQPGDALNYDAATGRIDAGRGFMLAGGGMPTVQMALSPFRLGAPLSGTLTVAPMTVGRSRLAVTPVRFAGIGSASGRIDTQMTLDGDFPGGRVEGFNMPVALRIGARTAFGPGCQPLRFTALVAAGARFGPASMSACPINGPFLIQTGGRNGIQGGFEIAAPRLTGRMGANPVTVSATRMVVPMVPLGFRLDNGVATIDAGDDNHHFTFAGLDGRFDSTGVSGSFNGLTAKIAHVPMLVDQGVGTWTFRQGVLEAHGGVQVSDSVMPDPRFKPMTAPDFELSLRDNVIHASAQLRHPASMSQIANVTIRHDLGTSAGQADIDVPAIYFRTDGLQPDMLTSTTLGVIANVRGDVSGNGQINWNAQGITSTGTFGTDNMDFAAAFGPVTGFATRVRFSDLIGLESAPHQEIRIGAVNPGMEALDGLIRYRLLTGNRVEIEGGRWPFNGGFLILDPTVLDLNVSKERRMTFRIDGLDAAQFMQQLGYQNISASGIFDGTIPMVFDDRGGRIEGGILVARDGGGTIAYVGELTRADLGMFGKMAFDALRSIRYRALTIGLEGSLDGEIVTNVKFDGLSQEPITPGAKVPFARTLKKLPFKFNITIRAPFRGLMNQATIMADPHAALRAYMPQPITDIPGVTP